jgi:hypothetical protein
MVRPSRRRLASPSLALRAFLARKAKSLALRKTLVTLRMRKWGCAWPESSMGNPPTSQANPPEKRTASLILRRSEGPSRRTHPANPISQRPQKPHQRLALFLDGIAESFLRPLAFPAMPQYGFGKSPCAPIMQKAVVSVDGLGKSGAPKQYEAEGYRLHRS